LGVLLGLTGAVCWGVAAFCARFVSRRVGAYRTLFFMQLCGFMILSAFLEFQSGFTRGVAPGWKPWAFAALAGALNAGASLALYYSFQVGVMSIVAPVSSCYPRLTVALALLSGERIRALRGAGLAIVVIGVILAGTSFAADAGRAAFGGERSGQGHLSKGVGWAILAAAGFGVLFWFLGFYVVPLTGATVSVWVMRFSTFATLALVAAPAGQSLRMPQGSVWWLIAAVGLMDSTAFIANNAGLHTGQVSLVSVLSSLYGGVTVLLSWIFLRERLEGSQWLGIALLFAGIVLVSL
jgi:drug/metabolite transporter (DMT)-like permease